MTFFSIIASNQRINPGNSRRLPYYMLKNSGAFQRATVVNKIYSPIWISSHLTVKNIKSNRHLPFLLSYPIWKMKNKLLTKTAKARMHLHSSAGSETLLSQSLISLHAKILNTLRWVWGDLKTRQECQPVSKFRHLSACGRLIIYTRAWRSDGEWKEGSETRKE